MRQIIYISTLILLLFSCEKPIDFDAEIKEPKLVINSFLIADTTLFAHVSKSLSVIDNGDLDNINDAEVTVYDANGNLLDNLSLYANGIYISHNIKPQEGEKYQIKVKKNGFKDVSGIDRVPFKTTLIFHDSASSVYNGENVLKFDLKFNDDISEENYYIIRCIFFEVNYIYDNNNNIVDLTITSRENGFYCIDQSAEGVNDNNYYYKGVYLQDGLFNGSTKNITIYASNYNLGEGSKLRFGFNLETVSENYYKYRLSVERFIETNGNPFAEPVQVFSNIENGFGVVGGVTIDSLKIF